VERLQLGTKTHAKLAEILATGQLRRNVELEGSDRQRCLALFGKVWGAAAATCDKWYAAGGCWQCAVCSAQQAAGLLWAALQLCLASCSCWPVVLAYGQLQAAPAAI
jgi:hypothetical protein